MEFLQAVQACTAQPPHECSHQHSGKHHETQTGNKLKTATPAMNTSLASAKLRQAREMTARQPASDDLKTVPAPSRQVPDIIQYIIMDIVTSPKASFHMMTGLMA